MCLHIDKFITGRKHGIFALYNLKLRMHKPKFCQEAEDSRTYETFFNTIIFNIIQ